MKLFIGEMNVSKCWDSTMDDVVTWQLQIGPLPWMSRGHLAEATYAWAIRLCIFLHYINIHIYIYIYVYIQIYTHPHTHAHCSLHDTTIYTWAVSRFHGQTLIQHIWRPWRLKPRGRLWTFSCRSQIGQECFPCFLPADFSGTSCFSNMECI